MKMNYGHSCREPRFPTTLLFRGRCGERGEGEKGRREKGRKEVLGV
jgi:hypothetical protein